MPVTKHGVLTKNGLLTIKGCQWQPTRFQVSSPSLDFLYEMAQAHELSHLWIMHDCNVLPERHYFEVGCEKWNLVATWKDLKELNIPGHVNELVSCTGWRKSERGDFQKARTITFPYNSKWHFCKAPDLDAKRLLITIDYLQKALGVTVGASPGTVGMKLIERANSDHPEWLAIPEIDLVACHFDRYAAQDLIWSRPLHHDEMNMKYLHKYDKNAAYLRACTNEMIGCGTPIHVEGSESWDKRAPGVWRVRVKEPILKDLPPVLWDKATWVASPLIKVLKDTGHTIKLYEGWVFPEYHEVLKDWAKLLWAQRLDFRDNKETWKHEVCREYARSATKDIAVATIGLSSFSHFEEKTFKARPDWRCQAVAGTRALMFYNMLKVQKDTGRTPIMVKTDALYYMSNEPDPAKAIPLLDKTDSLGGYKNDGWSLEVNQEVLSILTSEDGENTRLQKLNALVEERKYAGK